MSRRTLEFKTGRTVRQDLPDVPGTERFALVNPTIRVTIPASETSNGVSQQFDSKRGQIVIRLAASDTVADAESKAQAFLDARLDEIGSSYAGDNVGLGHNRFVYDLLNLGVSIVTKASLEQQNLLDLPLGKLHMKYSFAGVSINDDRNCVIMLLWHAVKTMRSRYEDAKRGPAMLRKELSRVGADLSRGVTINQLVAWVDKYASGQRVGLTFVDPAGQTFFQYPKVTTAATRFRVCAVVNDGHVYPIENPAVKSSLSQGGTEFAQRFTFKVPPLEPGSWIEVDVCAWTPAIVCRAILDSQKPFALLHTTSTHEPLFDLEPFMAAFQATTELFAVPSYLDGCMVAFKAPIEAGSDKAVIVILSADLKRVQRVCADLSKTSVPKWMFEFRGQSLPSVATSFFNFKVGRFPKSQVSPTIRRLMDSFPFGPLTTCFAEEFDQKQTVAIDICKAYSSALIENEVPFAIFDAFSQLEEFDAERDEYLVSKGAWFVVRNPITVTFFPLPLHYVVYPGVLLKYLLAIPHECSLRLTDINYKLVPSRTLPADHFKEATTAAFECLGNDAKHLVNLYIGAVFGRTYEKWDRGFMTNDFNIAQGVLVDAFLKDQLDKVQVHQVASAGATPSWHVRVRHKKLLFQNNRPLQWHVFASNIVALLKIFRQVARFSREFPEHPVKVVGCRTDAVYIELSAQARVKLEGSKLFEWKRDGMTPLAAVGSLQVEEAHVPTHASCKRLFDRRAQTRAINLEQFETDYALTRHFDDYATDSLMERLRDPSVPCTSALVCGPPGSGKSTLLTAIRSLLRSQGKRVATLSFTCAAVEVLKGKGIADAKTLSSAFFTGELGDEKTSLRSKLTALARATDVVLVDEYATVPHHMYDFFLWLKFLKPELDFFLFGDEEQTVTKGCGDRSWLQCDDKMTYAYQQQQAVRSLVGYRRCVLRYLPEFARYGPRLKAQLDVLVETGVLNAGAFKSVDREHTNARAICVTQKTKRRHDLAQMKAALAKAGPGEERLRLGKPAGAAHDEIVLVKGMPVRSRSKFTQRDNEERTSVFNNSGFLVESVDSKRKVFVLHRADLDGNLLQTRITVPARAFWQSYELDFAITVRRVQGNELSAQYDVLDLGKMTRNDLNTALSRARSIDQLHLDCEVALREFKWHQHPARSRPRLIRPLNAWWAGVVYLLSDSKSREAYIGETKAEGLSSAQLHAAIGARFDQHVASDKTPFDKSLTQERAADFKRSVLVADLFSHKSQLRRAEARCIESAEADGKVDLKNVDRKRQRQARPVGRKEALPAAEARVQETKINVMRKENKDGSVSEFLRLTYRDTKGKRKHLSRTFRRDVPPEDKKSHDSAMGVLHDRLAEAMLPNKKRKKKKKKKKKQLKQDQGPKKKRRRAEQAKIIRGKKRKLDDVNRPQTPRQMLDACPDDEARLRMCETQINESGQGPLYDAWLEAFDEVLKK